MAALALSLSLSLFHLSWGRLDQGALTLFSFTTLGTQYVFEMVNIINLPGSRMA